MKPGNLSAAFTENTEAEARAAALAWIEVEAAAMIETWTLLGLWQPRAARPFFWRAEFDVTYRSTRPRRGPLTSDLARERAAGDSDATDEQGRDGRRSSSAPVPPIAAGRAHVAGGQPHPGQVTSARESADGRRSRLCVEPEQGSPSADDGRGPRNSLPHLRPGAEPSGVTRTRTADGPRATSSDGDSPETEWAIASATPGRTAPVARP